MNILGICCGRKNGNTEIMMKEAFRAIEEECGARCELLNRQEVEIKSYVGCETCEMNYLKGDTDFRCIHNRDSDDFYFVEQKPKIGATFTIGGSDWTNYTLPVANLITMYLAGSFETIVDKCHFDFLPTPGAVALEADVLARVRLLGRRVARALADKAAGRRPVYGGEPGLCPDCHGTLLEKYADGWYCPQCLTRADITVEGGEVTVAFLDEAQRKNQCGAWGQELHIRNIQHCHKKAADNAEAIAARRRECAGEGHIVELPALKP